MPACGSPRRASGLVCKDETGGEVLIPGKTVICAVGQRSNRADVDALRTCSPWVRVRSHRALSHQRAFARGWSSGRHSGFAVNFSFPFSRMARPTMHHASFRRAAC